MPQARRRRAQSGRLQPQDPCGGRTTTEADGVGACRLTCWRRSWWRSFPQTSLSRWSRTYVRTIMVRTYRYYNVMSQLSDWKRAHVCTENHLRVWEDTRQPVERRSGCSAGNTHPHSPCLYVRTRVRTYVWRHTIGTRGCTRVPVVHACLPGLLTC